MVRRCLFDLIRPPKRLAERRSVVLGFRYDVIKNLAPAQDVDLPLPYPQLEHLVGEDRGVDDGGPRSDLKLAFWRAKREKQIVVELAIAPLTTGSSAHCSRRGPSMKDKNGRRLA